MSLLYWQCCLLCGGGKDDCWKGSPATSMYSIDIGNEIVVKLLFWCLCHLICSSMNSMPTQPARTRAICMPLTISRDRKGYYIGLRWFFKAARRAMMGKGFHLVGCSARYFTQYVPINIFTPLLSTPPLLLKQTYRTPFVFARPALVSV